MSAGQRHLERVLVVDRIDLVVHVENLALIEREAFHDVMEGVRVDGLLERLPQEVLAALGVRDVLEDGQHDVVAHEAFGGREKAEVAHDDAPLVRVEPVGLPQLDVALHGYLRRHPVVRAAVEVMLPRPGVLQGHELVHVHGLAVDEPFVVGVDAFGQVVGGGAFVGGGAAGHGGIGGVEDGGGGRWRNGNVTLVALDRVGNLFRQSDAIALGAFSPGSMPRRREFP